MFNSVKRYAFAGITAGLVALFTATTPAASGATGHTKSVCQTGTRGQAAYDRLCLHTGTRADAAKLWYSTPEGKKGKETDDFQTRRSICRYSGAIGVRAQAIDLVTDMTYDNFRNDHKVNAWVADLAQGDCLRMGYSDPVSGLVSVDLKRLPHRDSCWIEVYYLGHGKKIKIEMLCKG